MAGLFAVVAAATHVALAPAAASAPAPDEPLVLQEFAAGNYAFDLVIAPCGSDGCPFQVRLRQQGKTLDSFTLPVNAYSREAAAEDTDPSWGVDAGLKSWGTGIESRYVAAVARTATVAPGRTGLLVTQTFGFEHRKRAHVFVLPQDRKLVAAWSYRERSGPTWSSTEVRRSPSAKGVQDIVHFRGFGDPAEDAFERLDALRLSLAASSATLQETPLPDPAHPLYLVHAGTYATPMAARERRLASAYCLGAYWVLDNSRFPGVSGGKAVLGRIFTDRKAAEAENRSLGACLPGAGASVIQWKQGR